MPALYSLGQHSALSQVHNQLHLYAFLDDIYAVVPSARVRPVLDLLSHHLPTDAHVQLHQGKTRLWNAAGVQPPNTSSLHQAWVGDQALPPTQQGFRVLGVPVGKRAYIQQQLQNTTATHQQLLQQLPALDDLQASWLLLLFCASPRANYALRNMPPALTNNFAVDHDLATSATLAELAQSGPLPAAALARAHLPLADGGLGLLSATCLAPAAYWASWAVTLPILHTQAPHFIAALQPHFQESTQGPHQFQATQAAAEHLTQVGWAPLPCEQLLLGAGPPPLQNTDDQGPPTFHKGWQRLAAAAQRKAMKDELLNTPDPASQAMLASQSGPYASRAFTTIPYSDDLSFPSHLFRILLLRRLRVPLPLTERSRRCRRVLDPLGNLRAACPRSGVLRGRGRALERAAARNCREAGTRVTTNTLLTDLNIPSRHRLDQRRSEVIANGLPLYHGAQIAVDTTLVSPLIASSESARFLRLLATARARSVPALLRSSAAAAFVSRGSALLTSASLIGRSGVPPRTLKGPRCLDLCPLQLAKFPLNAPKRTWRRASIKTAQRSEGVPEPSLPKKNLGRLRNCKSSCFSMLNHVADEIFGKSWQNFQG